MQPTVKKFLPYIAAVVVFAVLTLVYFKPLLSGKEISQHDIMQAKGMSKEIVDFREKEHTEPLWTNSMFSGMPAYQVSTYYPGNLLGQRSADTKFSLDNLFKLFLPHPAGYIFLCFLGFFILLLCLKVDPWLALVGSLAYGLSTYFIVALGAGHNSKINALGYLPPLIGGLILLLRGKMWLGFALSVLFMALELNANHVQITYYGFMIIGAILLGYGITAFKEKTLPTYFKSAALFVVASIIAVLPNAGNLMCTEEYSKYSTRGPSELTITPSGKSNAENKTSGLDKDYVTQYSHGISESFTFLIPDYKGGSSSIPIGEEDPDALKKVSADFKQAVGQHGSYFGDQYITAGPVYIGAIIMFFVILGLFITKNKLKWPLLLITLLGMMLSWGSHFMGLTSFFLDHVPGYNKFRAVSMTMVIAELCLPLFAVLTISELLQFKSLSEKIEIGFIKKQVELKKILIITFAIVGGFCLIGYLAPGVVNSFTMDGEEQNMIARYTQGGNPEDQVRSYVTQLIPQLEIARQAIFKSDALRSFIFITLAFIFIYLYMNKKIKLEMLLVALGIFILIDMWTVDMRYLGEKNYVTKSQNMASFEKTPADEEILKDPDPYYRVLNVAASPFQDAATSYLHKSIGGYHGAKLKKYQELYDFYYAQQMQTFYGGIRNTMGNDTLINELFSKLGILNMLNTKYLIVPVGDDGRTVAMKNPQANGNVWFIKQMKLAHNADEEIMSVGNLDTKQQAVMQDKFKNDVKVSGGYSGEGIIKLISYKANELVYESDSKEEQFAVFSEIYYPKGWNAYLDGAVVPHVAVDYVLRGMPVPAGKHKIEFKFEPQTYKTSNNIAMVGSILVLASVAGGLFLGWKKGKTSS